MIKEFHTKSVEETELVGKELALSIDRSKPCFIAMYGDLGVGKTAFVRGFASVIAPTAPVPTSTATRTARTRCGNGIRVRTSGERATR